MPGQANTVSVDDGESDDRAKLQADDVITGTSCF